MARISGLLIGAVSLVVGIVAVVTGTAALAVLAGLLGLGAGAMAYQASSQTEHLEARATNAERNAALMTQQMQAATADAESAKTKAEELSASFAEYMEANPPAGSFDRKLDDTSADFGARSLAGSSDDKMLADPETNLFSEAYFRVALDARIASARRHLRPVAVAILEVVKGEGKDRELAAEPSQVTGAIRQTLRDADTACRMEDGSFALILEDTPENGAVWTVERIRRNLSSRHGQHTTWAGIACYPAHAFSTDEILEQASEALNSAREWQQDRIEIATAE